MADVCHRLVSVLPLLKALLHRFREPVRNFVAAPVYSFAVDGTKPAAARGLGRY